ncbi:hypothetical protein [Macrococcus lamae]|uniref:Uncharacterized protein n=1 Tax=Macrococcus lamae TaxID=198484 RepID=A0A4R6BW33_9STAP|nr:hypothetical protein [Macrococcus lamae]TDM12230.1 hypothetical protein ERX29_03965 [Macrococcus lamae]
MNEEKFVLIENQSMTLNELARELESITGYTVKDSFGDVNRIVAQKPNFDDDFESFLVTYEFHESDDIVDATITTPRDENVNLKTEAVKLRLLSYKSR